MRVWSLIYTIQMTFNYILGKKRPTRPLYIKNPVLQKIDNKNPNFIFLGWHHALPMVTLGPLLECQASKVKHWGSKTPQELAHMPTKAILMPKTPTGWRQGSKWWCHGPSRANIMVGGKDPPRSRPTKVPMVERPPFSLVQASDISLSLVGVSTSIWCDFIPMEVRANDLPICTCSSGMVL